MPQQAALYRRLTVAENLLLFARLEGVDDPEAVLEEMLEQTALGRPPATIRSGTLSGGNQQRVNIAIGLLAPPRGAAPSRPSSPDSTHASASACGSSCSASRAPGTTVIFTTHYIQEAERYGDRLLVLADGERVFDGTPRAPCTRRCPSPGPLPTSSRPSSTTCASGATERSCAGCCSRTCRSCGGRRWSPPLLIVYPVVIAILIGFALSRGPEKPARGLLQPGPLRRAVRPGRAGRRVLARRGPSRALRQDSSASTSSPAARRPESMVRDGDVLGALILPPDLLEKLAVARRR